MKQFRVDSVTRYANHVVLSLIPVSAADRIEFTPGQYATLSYQHHNGAWSAVRSLSFTNAPEESGRLEFAFRVTGKFTAGLSRLNGGEVLRLQGPFGEFVQDDAASPSILIAGGIGITPFLSMVRAQVENSSQRIVLLYSCQQASDVPYLTELQELTARFSNVTVYTFLNSLPAEKNAMANNFIKGPITKAHLARLVGATAQNYRYYICGPEGMMKAMRRNLMQLGAQSEQILTESFSAGSKPKSKKFGFSPVQLTYASGAAFLFALTGVIGFKDVRNKLAAQQPAASQLPSNNSASESDESSENEPLQIPTSNTSSSSNLDGGTISNNASTDTITSPTTSSTPSANSTTYQPPRTSVS